MRFLELDRVSRRYGAVQALHDVSLSIRAGGRTAIVGPSGSGKTTLLRLVAGFDAPDQGRILLDGTLLADGPRAVPAHRRGVGVVMQDGALFPHLTVADNIGFGLDRAAPDRAAAIGRLMDMVGLDRAMLPRRPDALSGGQQQRVALARALARRPRLMLLDEPFSALDTGLRASTRKAVAGLLAAAGITTVLVTHDQAEALSFADHLAVMAGGSLLQAGTPQDLYLRPLDATVATFLGDALILPATLHAGVADCALGHIAVDDPTRVGTGDIMLRPEQVTLAPAPNGCCEVLAIEFGGAACMVTLGAPGAAFALRQPGIGLPAVGTRVRTAIVGAAHVLRK
jgi:iron(III) transport system ATP-binding protein